MSDRLRLYSGSYRIVGRLVEGEYCTGMLRIQLKQENLNLILIKN